MNKLQLIILRAEALVAYTPSAVKLYISSHQQMVLSPTIMVTILYDNSSSPKMWCNVIKHMFIYIFKENY